MFETSTQTFDFHSRIKKNAERINTLKYKIDNFICRNETETNERKKEQKGLKFAFGGSISL